LPGGGTVVGAGAGGTLGFLKGSAIGLVAGAVVGSIIEDALFLLDTPNICPLVFFSKPPKDRPEHTKGARPSTKDKHEKGRRRVKKMDRPGGEKGDERRPFRNK